MARIPTFPVLLDWVMRLTTSDLKRLGFLDEDRTRARTIRWGNDAGCWGGISITVNLTVPNPYLEFNYTVDDVPVRYQVGLVSVASNLGVGKVWYFLCPRTRKRCRILYGVGGYFLHREAFPGVRYERQTRAKSTRAIGTLVDFVFDRPPKKWFYKGKPTRGYKRWLAKNQSRESILDRSGILENRI